MKLKLREWVFQDWAVNREAPAMQVLLAWFRLAQLAHRRWGICGKLVIVAPFSIVTTFVLGMEFPVTAQIGPRLRMAHHQGVMIHVNTTMGSDCCLRHGVSIGAMLDGEGKGTGVPRIGDGVQFGLGSVVLGDITVGNYARIGALTLVMKSVPDYAVVAGNPGRVIRIEGAQ